MNTIIFNTLFQTMPEVLSRPGFPNELAQNTNFSSTTTDTQLLTVVQANGFISDVHSKTENIGRNSLCLAYPAVPSQFWEVSLLQFGQINMTFMLPKILMKFIIFSQQKSESGKPNWLTKAEGRGVYVKALSSYKNKF